MNKKNLLIYAYESHTYEFMKSAGVKYVIDNTISLLKDTFNIHVISNYAGSEDEAMNISKGQGYKVIRNHLEEVGKDYYDYVLIQCSNFQIAPIREVLQGTNAKVLVTYHLNPIHMSFSINYDNLVDLINSDENYKNRITFAMANMTNIDHDNMYRGPWMSNPIIKSITGFIQNEINLPDNSPFSTEKEYDFIYVGRLEPLRYPGAVIDTLMKHPKTKDCKIVVVGGLSSSNPEFSNNVINNVFSKYDNVDYKGLVPKDEVLRLLSKSRYMIMSSIMDTSSIAVFEALWSGTYIANFTNPQVKTMTEEFKDDVLGRFIHQYDDRKIFTSKVKTVIDKLDFENDIMSEDDIRSLRDSITTHYNKDVIRNKYIKLLEGDLS